MLFGDTVAFSDYIGDTGDADVKDTAFTKREVEHDELKDTHE